MRERDIARAIVNASSKAAHDTRQSRRAQIVSLNDDGKYTVKYRGQEMTFPSSWLTELHDGTWVTLAYVDGALEISGPSAYSGGNYGAP